MPNREREALAVQKHCEMLQGRSGLISKMHSKVQPATFTTRMAETNLRSLPLGTSSFVLLRRFDQINVDKTDLLDELCRQRAKIFFRKAAPLREVLAAFDDSILVQGWPSALQRTFPFMPNSRKRRAPFCDSIFPWLRTFRAFRNLLSFSNICLKMQPDAHISACQKKAKILLNDLLLSFRRCRLRLLFS